MTGWTGEKEDDLSGVSSGRCRFPNYEGNLLLPFVYGGLQSVALEPITNDQGVRDRFGWVFSKVEFRFWILKIAILTIANP